MSADPAMFARLYAHVTTAEAYALWQIVTCRAGRPFPTKAQIREGVERGVRDNLRRGVRVCGALGDDLETARRRDR